MQDKGHKLRQKAAQKLSGCLQAIALGMTCGQAVLYLPSQYVHLK